MAIPKEPRGATITGKLDDVLARLDAQQEILIRQQASLDSHQVGLDNQQRLIAALHQDQSDMIRRMSGVEGRLTKVEDSLGKVLWGMTAIGHLLPPPADPGDEAPSAETSPDR